MLICDLILIPAYKVVPILQMRKVRLRELIPHRSLVLSQGLNPDVSGCKVCAPKVAVSARVTHQSHLWDLLITETAGTCPRFPKSPFSR